MEHAALRVAAVQSAEARIIFGPVFATPAAAANED